MREMATELFAEAKTPLEIAGLGLGIPGPIDTDRGLCLATQATAQAKPSSSLATAVTATERRLPRATRRRGLRCRRSWAFQIVEAFATGLPVIASRLGALAELVHDGCNGLHFRAGDPEDLAAKVEWLLANPKERAAMGRRAREEFLAKYTGERGYEMLMDIYSLAAERMRAGA